MKIWTKGRSQRWKTHGWKLRVPPAGRHLPFAAVHCSQRRATWATLDGLGRPCTTWGDLGRSSCGSLPAAARWAPGGHQLRLLAPLFPKRPSALESLFVCGLEQLASPISDGIRYSSGSRSQNLPEPTPSLFSYGKFGRHATKAQNWMLTLQTIRRTNHEQHCHILPSVKFCIH